jgi:hypothetical protein
MRSHTKKILFGFITFALIMACVPGMATSVPISTLDAYAINTYIVQTANVAAMRTASVPTLTATATLRSTFTPIPTYTLVGTLIPPSPLPIGKTQYYRVKHDTQLAKYNHQSRTVDPGWPESLWGSQTPEIVRLTLGQSLTSGTTRTIVDGTWSQYIDMLNDYNKKKINYVKADNTALFNGSGFPQLESLTMGGNVITLDEIQGDWGRVHTIDYSNPGPLKEVNYITRPDLVHKFVIIGWSRRTKSSYLSSTPQGDLYWPLVTAKPVWIPLEYLEPFPILPMEVTATKTQPIRQQPSLDSPHIRFDFTEGKTGTVIEYHPAGSDVWGQLNDGNWILLMRQGQFLTTWSMATYPPP